MVEGKFARGEIQKTISAGNIAFPSVLFPNIDLGNDRNLGDEEIRSRLETCSISSELIAGNADSNDTNQFSFPVPTENGVYLDLRITETERFFISKQGSLESGDARVSLRMLRGEATCKVYAWTDCTNPFAEGTVTVDFKDSVDVVHKSGSCLGIDCSESTETGVLRIRWTDPRPSTGTNLTVAGIIFGPSIFDSLSQIKDGKFYTRDSFNSCKKNLAQISLLATYNTSVAIQKFSKEINQARTCLTEFPKSPVFDTLSTPILGGQACKLEESKLFYLF